MPHLPAELNALWAELGIDPALLAARALPLHHEAATLVLAARGASGREFMLTPGAAAAWSALQAAARADGVPLALVSAFRSVARQAEIIRAQLAAGQTIAAVLRAVAPPGCSEHHSGNAVDIAGSEDDELDEAFEHSPGFAWLQRRAAGFGFVMSFPRGNPQGFVYEPWHWCWRAAP